MEKKFIYVANPRTGKVVKFMYGRALKLLLKVGLALGILFGSAPYIADVVGRAIDVEFDRQDQMREELEQIRAEVSNE